MRISELQALCLKAPEGPWSVILERPDPTCVTPIAQVGDLFVIGRFRGVNAFADTDVARYIAAAGTHLPALVRLAEVAANGFRTGYNAGSLATAELYAAVRKLGKL